MRWIAVNEISLKIPKTIKIQLRTQPCDINLNICISYGAKVDN